MTAEEFKKAKAWLNLSSAQLGRVLDLDARTIRRYMAGDRPVHPTVARAMSWLADGYQPPELLAEEKSE